MGYEISVNKAWEELIKLNPSKAISVKFLADEYSVDLKERKIISLSCNIPAKDFTAILVLHYLARKQKGLPALTGVWLPFRELAGIEGYAAAFRQRAIEPVIRKYGNNPQGFLSVLKRLPGKKAQHGDAGVILEVFEKVPVLVALWGKDEEFSADANIFFDQSITGIFCLEDIVVLAGIIAGAL